MTQPQTVNLWDYYRRLWADPPPAQELSDPRLWDQRALAWDRRLREDEVYRRRELERVRAVTDFLRRSGQLNPRDRVLDIGCGPGLFSVEFAKYTGHVTGLDLSPAMAGVARDRAKRVGAANTNFLAGDFRQMDLPALGAEEPYDLVVCCLTPAVTNLEQLHKAMALSRGSCLHVTFLDSSDTLEQMLRAKLFPGTPQPSGHWDGRIFCAVFNLLFLEGWFPRTGSFTQTWEEPVPTRLDALRPYAQRLSCDTLDEQEALERILSLLRRQELPATYRRTTRYGLTLWDVTDRRAPREGYAQPDLPLK